VGVGSFGFLCRHEVPKYKSRWTQEAAWLREPRSLKNKVGEVLQKYGRAAQQKQQRIHECRTSNNLANRGVCERREGGHSFFKKRWLHDASRDEEGGAESFDGKAAAA
jgi:hypothetical protein